MKKKGTILRLLLFTSLTLVLLLALAVPAFASSVLWDQPENNPGVFFADQLCSDITADSWVPADDFVNPAPWAIDAIYAPGEMIGANTTLLNATSLTWAIYADNSGVPGGNPLTGGGTPPVWTLTLAPADPKVTITTGSVSGNPSCTLLTLTTPVILPAGHWWLVFYPTMQVTYAQYALPAAATITGYEGRCVSPTLDWTVLGTPGWDLAFQLQGSVQSTATAQSLKKDALSALNTLLAGSLTKKQRPLVSATAALIAQSLKPAYWVDALHLKKSSGLAVFSLEASAAGCLVLAGKAGVGSTALSPVFSDLVSADRLLASTAIADAIAAPGNAGKITNAQKYLAKGDTAAAANQWVTAIGYYGTAWTYAVSAH